VLYNEDKLNENYRKQWKSACIEYIDYVIIIDVFCTSDIIRLENIQREEDIFIQQEFR